MMLWFSLWPAECRAVYHNQIDRDMGLHYLRACIEFIHEMGSWYPLWQILKLANLIWRQFVDGVMFSNSAPILDKKLFIELLCGELQSSRSNNIN